VDDGSSLDGSDGVDVFVLGGGLSFVLSWRREVYYFVDLLVSVVAQLEDLPIVEATDGEVFEIDFDP
jgi:hypothetical protein